MTAEIIDIGKTFDVEEINLNVDSSSKPSTNCGPGIELLMNGKRAATNDIHLSDLDRLEQELNDLSGTDKNNEPKLNFSESAPKINFSDSAPKINFSDSAPKINFSDSAPKVNFSDSAPKINFADEVKPIETRSWDGYVSANNVAIDPDKDVKPPEMNANDLIREKFKYLRRLEDFQSKGISVSKRYSMESSLTEMQGEYENIVAEREKSNSKKFQGKMLMAVITGLEFLNTKFDPFELKLDGWAEQLNENIDDYDDIFAELHEKYKSKAKMAPELKLMFQLVGGGIMLHMTNSMFKTSIPGMDDIMRQNPELMQKFTQAAMNTMNTTSPGFAGFVNSVAPEPRPYLIPKRSETTDKRPDMKGPTDINDILGGLKSKTINLNDPNEEGSTVSLSELKDMKDGLKKSKRKPKSDKTTFSLDI